MGANMGARFSVGSMGITSTSFTSSTPSSRRSNCTLDMHKLNYVQTAQGPSTQERLRSTGPPQYTEITACRQATASMEGAICRC